MKITHLLIPLFFCLAGYTVVAQPTNVIRLSAQPGADSRNLAAALEQARGYGNQPVTIRLSPGIYRLNRTEATRQLYYVSNTTSETEDPDPTKHIGLWLRSLNNLTIDGCGATLMLNGEMTALVLDSCRNITLKNLNIDQEYPTQIEMEVREEGEDYLIVSVHPSSQYRIKSNGLPEWYGEGWSFTNGIAQWYDRVTDTTRRAWSPTDGLVRVTEMEPRLLRLEYAKKPRVGTGIVFQVRDAIRDEVAGLVYRSKDIRFENVCFYYLGNFGVVCQTGENITFHRSRFAPRPGSGRTNAGFADFIQVSGCRGLVDINQCHFAGAHDDPINVHGTHLKLVGSPAPDQLILRYMHPQTYGFQSFFAGDEIELTDARSLTPVGQGTVKEARMLNPREISVTLHRPLPEECLSHPDLVVENVTWTPEVRITDNSFARIPTRGILLTTRRPSLIEGNTFYGMQMSAILVANDAQSWYESGPVHGLTIRRNTFIDCGEPVICILPENGNHPLPVHRQITIEENSFYLKQGTSCAIRAKAVDGLTIRNNFIHCEGAPAGNCLNAIVTVGCKQVVVEEQRR